MGQQNKNDFGKRNLEVFDKMPCHWKAIESYILYFKEEGVPPLSLGYDESGCLWKFYDPKLVHNYNNHTLWFFV